MSSRLISYRRLQEDEKGQETEKQRKRRREVRQKQRIQRLVIVLLCSIFCLLFFTGFYLGRRSKGNSNLNKLVEESSTAFEPDSTAFEPQNLITYSWEEEGISSDIMNKNNIVEAENRDILTLVNSTHSVPENWSVDLVYLINDEAIDRRAYEDLQNMMDDCRAEGLDPFICSSYRSHDKQIELFENKVNSYLKDGYSLEEAETQAATWIAIPGTSEHELGLSLDIVDESYQVLDEEQEKTETQIWLMENSWKYGYILRYPKDKSDITGISYEPWHYRYVGKEAAKEIYEQGLCLEEYLASR